MRLASFFLVLGLCSGLGLKNILSFQCDGTFILFANTELEITISTGILMPSFITTANRAINETVTKMCPSMPQAAKDALFELSVESALRVLDPLPNILDNTTGTLWNGCPANFIPILGGFNWQAVRNTWAKINKWITLPSSCTLANYQETGKCQFAFEVMPGTLNFELQFLDCGNGAPSFDLACSGSGCQTVFRPCTDNQECAPDFTCASLNTTINTSDMDQGMMQAGLKSSASECTAFSLGRQLISEGINTVLKLLNYTTGVIPDVYYEFAICGLEQIKQQYVVTPCAGRPTTGYWTCGDGSYCLTVNQLCDGITNCDDNSDESRCESNITGVHSQCPAGQVTCGWDVGCFPVCDGSVSCQNGTTDEQDCGPVNKYYIWKYCHRSDHLYSTPGATLVRSQGSCDNVVGSTYVHEKLRPRMASIASTSQSVPIVWLDCNGNIQLGNPDVLTLSARVAVTSILETLEPLLTEMQKCRNDPIGSTSPFDATPSIMARYFYPYSVAFWGGLLMSNLNDSSSPLKGHNPGAILDAFFPFSDGGLPYKDMAGFPSSCNLAQTLSGSCSLQVPMNDILVGTPLTPSVMRFSAGPCWGSSFPYIYLDCAPPSATDDGACSLWRFPFKLGSRPDGQCKNSADCPAGYNCQLMSDWYITDMFLFDKNAALQQNINASNNTYSGNLLYNLVRALLGSNTKFFPQNSGICTLNMQDVITKNIPDWITKLYNRTAGPNGGPQLGELQTYIPAANVVPVVCDLRKKPNDANNHFDLYLCPTFLQTGKNCTLGCEFGYASTNRKQVPILNCTHPANASVQGIAVYPDVKLCLLVKDAVNLGAEEQTDDGFLVINQVDMWFKFSIDSEGNLTCGNSIINFTDPLIAAAVADAFTSNMIAVLQLPPATTDRPIFRSFQALDDKNLNLSYTFWTNPSGTPTAQDYVSSFGNLLAAVNSPLLNFPYTLNGVACRMNGQISLLYIAFVSLLEMLLQNIPSWVAGLLFALVVALVIGLICYNRKAAHPASLVTCVITVFNFAAKCDYMSFLNNTSQKMKKSAGLDDNYFAAARDAAIGIIVISLAINTIFSAAVLLGLFKNYSKFVDWAKQHSSCVVFMVLMILNPSCLLVTCSRIFKSNAFRAPIPDHIQYRLQASGLVNTFLSDIPFLCLQVITIYEVDDSEVLSWRAAPSRMLLPIGLSVVAVLIAIIKQAWGFKRQKQKTKATGTEPGFSSGSEISDTDDAIRPFSALDPTKSTEKPKEPGPMPTETEKPKEAQADPKASTNKLVDDGVRSSVSSANPQPTLEAQPVAAVATETPNPAASESDSLNAV